MSKEYVSEKLCAGEYKISLKGHKGVTVSISQVHYPDDGDYWIAVADFEQYNYTDPLDTKREALLNAVKMLKNRINGTDD